MRLSFCFGAAVLLLSTASAQTLPTYEAASHSYTVSFVTADSVTVFADWYPAQPHVAVGQAPVVLLLHQSASNSEEYRPIAPRLAALGYNALALDARGGGHRFGRANRTNANLPHHGGGKEAFWDFKAALQWLREAGFAGPFVLWGSSYSGGRLFHVMTERPAGVVATLSFSPGRGFARRGPEGEPSWAEQATVPAFVTWAPHELTAERRADFARIAAEKVLYEQPAGRHGASTLHPTLNPEGHEAIFSAALRFLQQHAPSTPQN